MWEFHVEKGGLEAVEAEVASDEFVEVLLLGAVIAEEAGLGGEVVIVGDEEAGVSEST